MSGAFRRGLIGFALAMSVASATVHAVTVRDIVELSRAGLSDDILVALIEIDKSVIFTLTTDQILELKHAGVSDRVVIAMIQQGRKAEKNGAPAPRETNDDPPPTYAPPPPYYPPPPAPSTTVVVVPQVTPIFYPVFYPAVPVHRFVRCTPGRVIGRTERNVGTVPGRMVTQGRTGSPVFVADPFCE
jgi:hypothetical protein